MRWEVRAKAAHLPTPVVISPRENLVGRRRARKPRPNRPIEPRLLLMRIVHRHEWAEAVRAHVAGNDHEIARRNLRQKPVLVTERHDSHVTLNPECRIVRREAASVRTFARTCPASPYANEVDEEEFPALASTPHQSPRPRVARRGGAHAPPKGVLAGLSQPTSIRRVRKSR